MRWSYWCSILRQASLCTSCCGKTCVRSHGHTTKDRKSMESAFWRSHPFYSQSIWCHGPLCSHFICHSNWTVKFLCKNWSPLKGVSTVFRKSVFVSSMEAWQIFTLTRRRMCWKAGWKSSLIHNSPCINIFAGRIMFLFLEQKLNGWIGLLWQLKLPAAFRPPFLARLESAYLLNEGVKKIWGNVLVVS